MIVFLQGHLVVWRFYFLKLPVHFWYVVFGWCRSMWLVLYCLVSVFSGVFLIFQGQKTTPFYYCSNLIGKPLACCLKTSTFLPDLYHSFPITSLRRVALKIVVKWKLVVFPSPCFAFWSLIVVVANVVIQVPEKRTANIHRMTVGSPMLAIKRAPVDHDTPACCLVPRFVILRLDIFIMGCILWLYQT